MNKHVPNMKRLLPLITIFLASCGVHNHRYADDEVYYQDNYYAYDNYDPYYGYGTSAYSTAGDGVYYNNYNYYPDRWGVTYSNVNYSPFRYPRVGFYFSSGHNCGYSYWSTWCSSNYWPSSYYGSSYYASSWWPSYGFGLSYSSYYNDNYWWYNHWRNRNYYHNRPTQHGYYSARNEARRLSNGRYNSRYKYQQPRNNQRNGYYNRSNPNGVSRSRSTGNRVINRSSGTRNSRSNQPVQRSRQQSAVLQPNRSNYRQVTAGQRSARSAVSNRVNERSLQNRVQQNYAERNLPNSIEQQPTVSAREQVSQRTRQTSSYNTRSYTQQKPIQAPVRVKPMNSQSPVYYSNSRPNTARQTVVQPPTRRTDTQRSQVQYPNSQGLNNVQRVPNNSPYVNNRVVQPRVQQQSRPQAVAPRPVQAPVTKPAKPERSIRSEQKYNRSSNQGRRQSGRSMSRGQER